MEIQLVDKQQVAGIQRETLQDWLRDYTDDHTTIKGEGE